MMSMVYHSNYFIWFEIARIHLLDELGLPYREMERSGYRLPVLEAHANYLQPARFDDIVTLKALILEKPGKVRLRIDYEVHCEDKLLCTGYSKHAFIDPKGKPTRAPEDLIRLIEQAASSGGAVSSP